MNNSNVIDFYLKTSFPIFKKMMALVGKLIFESKINDTHNFGDLILLLLNTTNLKNNNGYNDRKKALFEFLKKNPKINFKKFVEFIFDNYYDYMDEKNRNIELSNKNKLKIDFYPNILRKSYNFLQKHNDKQAINEFMEEILKKKSFYTPVGILDKEGYLQYGPVYNGLEIQWPGNKEKLEKLLKKKSKVKELLESTQNKVLNPLKTIIEESNNGLELFFDLLKNLIDAENYFERAFLVYDYLYNMGISINGDSLIEGVNNTKFITYRGVDGTFLTPIYQLYDTIIEKPKRDKEAIEKRKKFDTKKISKKITKSKSKSKKQEVFKLSNFIKVKTKRPKKAIKTDNLTNNESENNEKNLTNQKKERNVRKLNGKKENSNDNNNNKTNRGSNSNSNQ